VQAVRLIDDMAGGDVKRSERGGRSVALKVVRRSAGNARSDGDLGCVRSGAWIWRLAWQLYLQGPSRFAVTCIRSTWTAPAAVVVVVRSPSEVSPW
jgi:hypothetical protein